MKLTDGARTAAYWHPKGVRLGFTVTGGGTLLMWTDGEIYEWTEPPGWYRRTDGTVVHWIYFCSNGTMYREYHSCLETMGVGSTLKGAHSPI